MTFAALLTGLCFFFYEMLLDLQCSEKVTRFRLIISQRVWKLDITS
jgi:hypothetical protein